MCKDTGSIRTELGRYTRISYDDEAKGSAGLKGLIRGENLRYWDNYVQSSEELICASSEIKFSIKHRFLNRLNQLVTVRAGRGEVRVRVRVVIKASQDTNS